MIGQLADASVSTEDSNSAWSGLEFCLMWSRISLAVWVADFCGGFDGETGYFRRMLKWRFLGVITTLPSRASHPTAHSKMGPLPSTSFLSCASESSPWVLRAYQMAPAIWPMSSSMVNPIFIILSQLSPDD
jgi:hypothetical protein